MFGKVYSTWGQAQELQTIAAASEQQPHQPRIMGGSGTAKLLQKLDKQPLHGLILIAKGT